MSVKSKFTFDLKLLIHEYSEKLVSIFPLSKIRVATNLENMENLESSGNLKNCQNLRENSGKFEFL